MALDKSFSADGTYKFKILERGSGPTGKYTRSYQFRAKVLQGIAVPATFDGYVAVMRTERGGVWRTHREPMAGYMFLFWEKERLRIDIELLELWDRHPVRMNINGIHEVSSR